MEIRKLTYFVAAAKTENFNRAAELCHVAQPALGRQIAALEAELGFPLFERRKQRVLLTEEGRAYLEYAQAALDQLQRGKQAIGAVRNGLYGNVSIGCIDPLGTTLLPAMLAPLAQRYPQISLQLWFGGADEVAHAVAHGTYDIGLTHLSPMQTAATELLIIHQLYHERLHLVAAASHPLAAATREGNRLTLDTILAEPFVLYPHASGSGIRNVVDRICASHGHTLRPLIETTLTENLKAFVRAGVGLTFLLPTDLGTDPPDPTLALIPLADLVEEFAFVVIYRRGGTLTPATRTVIQAMTRTGAAHDAGQA